jgi:hypothetical protein
MYNIAVADIYSRSIIVYRGNSVVRSSSSYVGGETLLVAIKSFNLSKFDVAIEAKVGMYCHGK